MENKETALKELDWIGSAILKHEELRMKVKNWMITLIVLLLVAYLSDKVKISDVSYFTISSTILLFFLWIEMIYGVAQLRAKFRGLEIEAALRGEIEYDGPKIGLSIAKPSSIREQFQVINNIRVYGAHLVLAIIVILTCLIK